jgi:hypothetical protein
MTGNQRLSNEQHHDRFDWTGQKEKAPLSQGSSCTNGYLPSAFCTSLAIGPTLFTVSFSFSWLTPHFLAQSSNS